MRGYLTVLGKESGQLIVEDSRVELYRDPGGSHSVYARKEDAQYDLGVSDITVSRPEDGTPPVAIEPRQACIEIHNRGNSNPVSVNCDGDSTEIKQGRTERIEDTATVSIGYQTTLQMRVEREAKREINVAGKVEGDLVAGDQQNVDKSTQVIDSVVNRSDIGGEGEPATVEDSTVNRSHVGGEGRRESGARSGRSDTKNHCERHNRVYTGEVCPECAKAGRHRVVCGECGQEVEPDASFCTGCGSKFPDNT